MANLEEIFGAMFLEGYYQIQVEVFAVGGVLSGMTRGEWYDLHELGFFAPAYAA